MLAPKRWSPAFAGRGGQEDGHVPLQWESCPHVSAKPALPTLYLPDLAHINTTRWVPVPRPSKTHTQRPGTGFYQVWVWVALKYPRVTRYNP